MSKVLFRLVFAAAMAAMTCSAALAQTVDGTASNCETDVFLSSDGEQGPGFAVMNTCGAAGLARQQDIYVPAVVQRALKNSFGFGPPSVQPAGLTEVIADDASDRLATSELQIMPTAAEAPATPMWNAWVDGRYLQSDYTASAGDLDGPTWSGLAGIDYKLNSKTTIGLLVSGDRSELDSALTNLNSHSVGIGPYLGVVLTDNIVFSANLLGSWIDSEQAGGLLQFDTSRVQASAGLTGYWYSDTVRFTPGLTLTWSKDWEKETNNLFPDRTIEIALLTPSLQLGRTVQLSDTTTVEPWAGLALDWTFLSQTDVSGGSSKNDPSTDLRVQAGFNFGFGTTTQLAVTGEYAGLLLDDLDSYSVEANLAFQF